jgi:hypothetical protein
MKNTQKYELIIILGREDSRFLLSRGVKPTTDWRRRSYQTASVSLDREAEG